LIKKINKTNFFGRQKLTLVSVPVTEKESVLVETRLVFEPVKVLIKFEPVEPVVMMRRSEPGHV
jgi:hypothetical protein